MTLRNINRIAVIKLRHIGDTLLATPALRNLRDAFPGAKISVFVAEGTQDMLANNPDIDGVIVVERKARSLRSALLPYFKMFTGKFDLVLDYTTGDRATWLTLCSRADIRAAFRTLSSERTFWKRHIYTHFVEPPPSPTHEVIRHFKLLEAVGIPVVERPLRLDPDQKTSDWARGQIAAKAGQTIIHLHPVSRWLFKCWEDESMAGIIQRLTDECNARIVITSSPDPKELERIANILRIAERDVVDLSGRTTLMQTAAISRMSDLFVGVDTGPMHMAAAVGTPVVALFGPSGADVWHPWGTRHRTIYKGCACNESRQKLCAHEAIRDCLRNISVDEVFNAITELLQKQKSDSIKV
ncbi:putative lipopolysaccharide heptosyltransferase III [Kamptonema cortianum]|nr:putative lipopolysaccharide heptosyltransferase III [Oscillatoria laete-virens]MDK3156455.1 putative lipopolysaccharide heptosyltransferase III [Kamptonema cortianum]MDL5053863.1 putative lipopolysaccharide heptosyltransferase III [Oscillatoria laete-virens NRMC-F 0139]